MTGRPAELQKFVHARRGAPAMDEAVRAMRAPEEKHRLAHDSAWRIRGASEMELAPAVTVATPVSTAGRTRPRRRCLPPWMAATFSGANAYFSGVSGERVRTTEARVSWHPVFTQAQLL
jgi:hypothetical protein